MKIINQRIVKMVKFFRRVVTLCGKRTSIRMSEVEWQPLENIS